MIHYAGHAETLAAFFDGMGIHRTVRSFPGSALFFEFIKADGKLMVRMYYFDGEKKVEETIRFPNQQSERILVTDFLININKRLN